MGAEGRGASGSVPQMPGDTRMLLTVGWIPPLPLRVFLGPQSINTVLANQHFVLCLAKCVWIQLEMSAPKTCVGKTKHLLPYFSPWGTWTCWRPRPRRCWPCTGSSRCLPPPRAWSAATRCPAPESGRSGRWVGTGEPQPLEWNTKEEQWCKREDT